MNTLVDNAEARRLARQEREAKAKAAMPQVEALLKEAQDKVDEAKKIAREAGISADGPLTGGGYADDTVSGLFFNYQEWDSSSC